MDGLGGIEAHWAWITLGLVLAGTEMLVPGVYLIWLALAALATGVLTAVVEPSLPVQIIDFVALSLIAVFSARRFLQSRPLEGPDPLLNRRGMQMVGQSALVVQAIAHGQGRVRLGDGEWLAEGPDMAEGQRVRVVATRGTVLLVEALALPDGSGSASGL
ncbi:membrane protein [Croceibacterium mercuriale]|uniref:Membrane protein n=1 Tax=Croceibacterium mercuriale TaxID=1572751 RepID=A0A0B2BSA9_9SPHN|nr:NfeD family protein [Croceibacterium mercuriale]KHL24473.1 membrane protein [Croceibacterium mercuriale]